MLCYSIVIIQSHSSRNDAQIPTHFNNILKKSSTFFLSLSLVTICFQLAFFSTHSIFVCMLVVSVQCVLWCLFFHCSRCFLSLSKFSYSYLLHYLLAAVACVFTCKLKWNVYMYYDSTDTDYCCCCCRWSIHKKTFSFIVAHVYHPYTYAVFDCSLHEIHNFFFKCNWDEISNIQMNFYILWFFFAITLSTWKVFPRYLQFLFSDWTLACKYLLSCILVAALFFF